MVYNRFLRFTFGVTPADLLAVSMTAEPFSSTYLQTTIDRARDRLPGRRSTDWTMPAINFVTCKQQVSTEQDMDTFSVDRHISESSGRDPLALGCDL